MELEQDGVVKISEAELQETKPEDRLGKKYTRMIERLKHEISMLEKKLEERKKDEKVQLNSDLVKRYIESNENYKRREKERLELKTQHEGTLETLRDLEEFTGTIFTEVGSSVVKSDRDPLRRYAIKGSSYDRNFQIVFSVPEYGEITPIMSMEVSVDDYGRELLGNFIQISEEKRDVALFLTGFSSLFRKLNKRNNVLRKLQSEYRTFEILDDLEFKSLSFAVGSSMVPNPLFKATFTWSLELLEDGYVSETLDVTTDAAVKMVKTDSSGLMGKFPKFFEELSKLKGVSAALEIVCSLLQNLEIQE